jgi:hypothetical protein
MRQELRLSVVTLLGIALVVSGCSTTTSVWTDEITVTPVAAVLPKLERGEDVRVIMKSGRNLYCRVERVDAEFLHGCSRPVALADISELRVGAKAGAHTMALKDLRRGDEVKVTTRSGDVKEFTITRVGQNMLRGEQVEVVMAKMIKGLEGSD